MTISTEPVLAAGNAPEKVRETRRFSIDSFIGLARRLTGNRPHLLVVLATLLSFAASYGVAYLIRFEFSIPANYRTFFWATLPYVLLLKLITFYANGIYRILWAYVGLRDLYRILLTSAFATGLIAITNLVLLPWQMVPRSILLVDSLFTFLAVGGVYALLRSLREVNSRLEGRTTTALEPVFIVGAGDAGEALLRELQRNGNGNVRVAGFLDDDPTKRSSSLRGVRVLGAVQDAKRLAKDLHVRKAFIAIPGAAGPETRRVVNTLLEAGIAMKILPPIAKLSPNEGFATRLREVSIEDLLRREPVKLDLSAIESSIRNKVVLVTGAAGSIGSELCRQITELHPSKLIALDLAESPLHALQLELDSQVKGADVVPELADVTDSNRIKGIFEKYTPVIVFHAAALKHVPMMEAHPQEAVRVNVHGTRIVAEAAQSHGCGAFILISTDKAVRPTSIMGASKRTAELFIRKLAAQTKAGTRFMAVRFGNVLGSNGSVLPIFKAQLAKGGPLTVTHPQMRRYFMTIPEAVQLVLQASVLGEGGETFVLEMGQPVYIKDLAEDLIRLSGMTPGQEVKIEFTGVRPGEKLFEEIRMDSEDLTPTLHSQVYRLAASQGGESSAYEMALSSGMDRCNSAVDYLRKAILDERSESSVGSSPQAG
jgi:FlaA1/EpsC-like NDP-sugar epimerase